MLISVIVTAVLLLVILELLKFIYWSKLYNIPGPRGIPLLGNALSFSNPSRIFSMIEFYTESYGNILKVFLGPKPYILISDPDFLEYIFTSTKLINKGTEYKLSKTIMGDGLLISRDEKWRKRRKVLTPSFHFKILEDFIKIFDEKSYDLIKNLKNEIGKDSFDLHNIIGLYTLDVICETAMGTKINAQNNKSSNYVTSINQVCYIFYTKLVNPHYQIPFIYKFTKLNKIEKQVDHIINDFSSNVIKSRRKVLTNRKDSGEYFDEFGIKEKCSFLDVLLKSTIDGEYLTDKDIKDEVNIFMFEGHDTTSVALSAAIYYLGIYQDVQEKAIEELKNIFGSDRERPISHQEITQMNYLELVIKETLRLVPSVPFHTRIVEEDFDFGGQTYPKGCTLTIVTYLMHRNKIYYPDPEKFIPERFTQENQRNRPTFSYIPFSAGSRNCIGQRFAMFELKVALAHVLMHYKILPAIPSHKPELTVQVTMKSLNGFKIKLEERIWD